MMTAKRVNPASGVDTTGWLTRNQALDLLGVSMTSIYRWEREGRLRVEHAQRGDSVRQVVVYDPDELAKMPRRNRGVISNEAGELTARVYEMLDEGKSEREIVIMTRQTPLKIDELKDAWLDDGGGDLVIARTAKAELERFVGPFATVSDLVKIITDRLGAKLEATVPDHASDAQIERGIDKALDAAGAP